jgi:TonB family protein
MKKLIFSCLLILLTNAVKAQINEKDLGDPQTGGKVDSLADPRFPGGARAFYRYIKHNKHYPKDAHTRKIEGRVFISFVVGTDGSLSSIKIIRGVSTDIDAEALRLMKNSPKWKPRVQNGKPVKVLYTVPINFTLSDKK